MKIIPITLKQANDLVGKEHRHHAPTVGHKFSIGLADGDTLVGAVIVGRPVARAVDHTAVAEVTRLVTTGVKNGCSMLYSAAARAAKAMGYVKIQTYILEDEPGVSLRAAGWEFETMTNGGNWNHGTHKNRREDQPMCPKQRWAKKLV